MMKGVDCQGEARSGSESESDGEATQNNQVLNECSARENSTVITRRGPGPQGAQDTVRPSKDPLPRFELM